MYVCVYIYFVGFYVCLLHLKDQSLICFPSPVRSYEECITERITQLFRVSGGDDCCYIYCYCYYFIVCSEKTPLHPDVLTSARGRLTRETLGSIR
uniref:Putative secreted protein n=1 Tax=Anopheles darlingi TaxID=43151 RepID=A0A2M4DF80_ANODA